MPMPSRQLIGGELYRYSFQGQEKDPETGKEAFKLRLWDGRIGRWLTTDPAGQYSSPYLGMGNNPINGIDGDGGCFRSDGSDCDDNAAVGTVQNDTFSGYSYTMTNSGWARDDGYEVNLGAVSNNSNGFSIQDIVGWSSSGFGAMGEIGAYNYNQKLSKLFSSKFTKIAYNGTGYVDEMGKIWRSATKSNLVRKTIVKGLPMINRYGTVIGKAGGGLTAIDSGMSLVKGYGATNSNDQIYYTVEGFLKAPALTPGPIGLLWGVSFDYTIRPIWHRGTITYRDAIHRGADPSIVFIMPGLGYIPPIKH
jgi:RHS repeat-associated protein